MNEIGKLYEGEEYRVIQQMFCPKCFNNYPIGVYGDMNPTVKIPMGISGTPKVKFYMNIDAEAKCDKCATQMVTIDKSIVDIIETLNKKGYTTLFSCEGHVIEPFYEEEFSISNPYILFAQSKNIEDAIFGSDLSMITDKWDVSIIDCFEDDDWYQEKAEKRVYINSKCTEKEPDENGLLDLDMDGDWGILREWLKTLPDISNL